MDELSELQAAYFAACNEVNKVFDKHQKEFSAASKAFAVYNKLFEKSSATFEVYSKLCEKRDAIYMAHLAAKQQNDNAGK